MYNADVRKPLHACDIRVQSTRVHTHVHTRTWLRTYYDHRGVGDPTHQIRESIGSDETLSVEGQDGGLDR